MRNLSVPLNTELVPALQRVEVMTFFQIPSFHIVGLPGREVEEARERIRAAVESSGLEFPRRRIVLNLSPASVRKRGTGLDLPMALGVLMGGDDGGVALAAWGELGLDGSVKSVGQVTRAVHAAGSGGMPYLILPRSDLPAALEACALIREARVAGFRPPGLIGVRTLLEAWDAARDPARLAEPPDPLLASAPRAAGPGASALPVSAWLGRALGVAAAGRHHLLLLGARGTGKSVALDTLTALQPPIAPEVRLRQTLARELAGSREREDTGSARRIGTNASLASLIGGIHGDGIVPGEYTLADGGLLVADEFPEWNRAARESLREPLQTGEITLTRAARSARLPARFRLAANGNLCPCGAWPDAPPSAPGGGVRLSPVRCRCTEASRRSYLAKLSGPVLDRIDMIALLSGAMAGPEPGARSIESLAARVLEVHEAALALHGVPPGDLSPARVNRLLSDHDDWAETLSSRKLTSLRSIHQAVRVALTLALWDGEELPSARHLSEAAYFRPEKLGLFE